MLMFICPSYSSITTDIVENLFTSPLVTSIDSSPTITSIPLADELLPKDPSSHYEQIKEDPSSLCLKLPKDPSSQFYQTAHFLWDPRSRSSI